MRPLLAPVTAISIFLISCNVGQSEKANPKAAIVERQRIIQKEIAENKRKWDSIRLSYSATSSDSEISNRLEQYGSFFTVDTMLKMELDSLELELKKY